MKIAVTSQNFRTITGHAGKTRRFIIYQVDDVDNIREIQRLDLPRGMSMHAFQGTEHPIDGIDYLITQGCGHGFIMKMQRRGIVVHTTEETDPLTAVRNLFKKLEC